MENTSYDMLHNVNHNNCNHMIYSIWVYDLLTYDILRAHVDWSNFVQNIGFDKTEKSTYYYILHSTMSCSKSQPPLFSPKELALWSSNFLLSVGTWAQYKTLYSSF